LRVGIYATTLAIFATATFAPIAAHAQATPTATQTLRLSAFGAATGTYTGLNGGRNLGITAGADLGFHPFYGFHPSLEVRGTYPFVKGQVISQKNILGGLKVERFYGRYHPYADILFGRAATHFENGGFPNPQNNFVYTRSPANVLSPGVGIDVTLTDHFALKADFQFQRYASPVTTSRRLYAKPLSLGVVYRFNFNSHHPR
jgi:hypothetical protein